MASQDFQLVNSSESGGSQKCVAVQDKPLTFRVPRNPQVPQDLANTKGRIDELLVLEGVECPGCKLLLEVYINYPSADHTTLPDVAEYVGSFYALARRSNDQTLSIRRNLEILGLENATEILVTIVPKGDTQCKIPIRGAHIAFA